MQVGISTASFFAKCAVEDTPDRIKRCGASLAEAFLNTFSEYQKDFIDLLSQRFCENGITIYSVHPMGTQFEPQLFSIHSRQRQDALRIYEEVLDAAKRLGARYYIMHGPASMHGTVKNMEFSRIGPIVKELCETALSYGITLAWENVSWCLFHWPDFALRLTDAAKTEALHFTLDLKQAARSGFEPQAYIAAIGKCGAGRLANVHVCDYAKEQGRVRPALPGKGQCDFRAVRLALNEIQYTGPAFLEVYSDLYDTDEELSQSYQYIMQQLRGK